MQGAPRRLVRNKIFLSIYFFSIEKYSIGFNIENALLYIETALKTSEVSAMERFQEVIGIELS